MTDKKRPGQARKFQELLEENSCQTQLELAKQFQVARFAVRATGKLLKETKLNEGSWAKCCLTSQSDDLFAKKKVLAIRWRLFNGRFNPIRLIPQNLGHQISTWTYWAALWNCLNSEIMCLWKVRSKRHTILLGRDPHIAWKVVTMCSKRWPK